MLSHVARRHLSYQRRTALLEQFKKDPKEAAARLQQLASVGVLPSAKQVGDIAADLLHRGAGPDAAAVLRFSMENAIAVDYDKLLQSKLVHTEYKAIFADLIHAHPTKFPPAHVASIVRTYLADHQFTHAVQLFQLIQDTPIDIRVLNLQMMKHLTLLEGARARGIDPTHAQTLLFRFMCHKRFVDFAELVRAVDAVERDATSWVIKESLLRICKYAHQPWPQGRAQIRTILQYCLDHRVPFRTTLSLTVVFGSLRAKLRNYATSSSSSLDDAALVDLFLALLQDSASPPLIVPDVPSCMSAIYWCRKANDNGRAEAVFNVLFDHVVATTETTDETFDIYIYTTGFSIYAKTGNDARAKTLLAHFLAHGTSHVLPDQQLCHRILCCITSDAASWPLAEMFAYLHAHDVSVRRELRLIKWPAGVDVAYLYRVRDETMDAGTTTAAAGYYVPKLVARLCQTLQSDPALVARVTAYFDAPRAGNDAAALLEAIVAARPRAASLAAKTLGVELVTREPWTDADVEAVTALLTSCLDHHVEFGHMHTWHQVFEKMRAAKATPVSALTRTYLAMVDQELTPRHTNTSMAAMHACQDVGDYDLAMALFVEIRATKGGAVWDKFKYNNGVYLCAKTGNQALARDLVDEFMATPEFTPDTRLLSWVLRNIRTPATWDVQTIVAYFADHGVHPSDADYDTVFRLMGGGGAEWSPRFQSPTSRRREQDAPAEQQDAPAEQQDAPAEQQDAPAEQQDAPAEQQVIDQEQDIMDRPEEEPRVATEATATAAKTQKESGGGGFCTIM
ncbi:Aste57867_10194 [Aphanomyces stellatus]|uniref:Aste57867_10194 protein n=1 Tax=Aphanomyces stellatus TaxID=120398 RepID=A0A485KQH6_9STRA|nr:hypothetical protein As57867_010155 [Aphanomyces stellatus]VFT87070.1 Aste57867_10194 [Aphanomyces stellatus]